MREYVYVSVLVCVCVFVRVGNHLMTAGKCKCSMSDLAPVLSTPSLAVGLLAELPGFFCLLPFPGKGESDNLVS